MRARTALDDANALPRFNMPLELGIALGCKAYSPDCVDQSLLIFDSEQYRFQKFVSDLSGQDIHQHGNSARLPSLACATGSGPNPARAGWRGISQRRVEHQRLHGGGVDGAGAGDCRDERRSFSGVAPDSLMLPMSHVSRPARPRSRFCRTGRGRGRR